jgi:N6-L-threonylcarbamoyladenine synthase
LLVGLSLGKGIAYGLGRPFYAVHHLEGHLYSPFLAPPPRASEPASPPAPPEPVPERFVGLVVSGGHTTLFAVVGGAVETLGETRDDAMGEVFDKVGKRLGLPYPQGPRVDELAEAGDRAAAGGTAPAGPRLAVASCVDDSLDFSYSGLKSQTLVELERLGRRGVPTDLSRLDGDPAPPPPELLALLAAFRRAAVAQLVDRLDRLHRRRPIPLLAVSGGVAANRLRRREVAAWAADREVELRQVPLVYSGDNAAMIAYAALLWLRRGESDDPFAAEAASRIPL